MCGYMDTGDPEAFIQERLHSLVTLRSANALYLRGSHWLAGSSSRQPLPLIGLYVRNAFADRTVVASLATSSLDCNNTAGWDAGHDEVSAVQHGPQLQCEGAIIASQSPANTLSAAAAACLLAAGHSHVRGKLTRDGLKSISVHSRPAISVASTLSPTPSLLTLDNWTIPFPDSSSRREAEHLNSDEFQIILCSRNISIFQSDAVSLC